MNVAIKKSVKYVCKVLWKEKPSAYFVYAGNLLCKFAELVQNIVIPKFIIDEVVIMINLMRNGEVLSIDGELHEHLVKAVFFVVITLIINFIRNLSNSALEHYKGFIKEFFNEYCRLQISSKSLSMDFEETENPETLNKLSQAQDGIDWYSEGVMGIMESCYKVLSSIVSCFAITGIIIWKCPVLLPLQIIAVFLSALINGKANKIEISYFDRMAKMNRIFGYFFWSFSSPQYGKDIRLYNSEKLMTNRADSFNSEITGMFRERSIAQRRWWYLSTSLGVVRNILTNAYICWKAVKNPLLFSIGDISMMLGAFGNFYNLVWETIWSSQEINRKCHYFNRYLEFLDLPETKKKGNLPVQNKKHTVEFKNVYFKYPRAENFVLENVNIKIKEGEHLSVVGLNGAGKTTFIKLLCRLYDVTSGQILIDGINIKEYDEDEYKKIFSVVFQYFKIFAFSIKENIALAQSKNAEEKELEKILCQTGLYDDVEKLPLKMNTSLSKQYDKGGIEFSGGQQQKTAISRALYRNSSVVILDEPTAALDPVAEYEIYRQFNSLVGGKTAVYISHRLSSCKFCDRIAVFSEGTIKEYGTHEELVKRQNGLYARMFSEQARYYVDNGKK